MDVKLTTIKDARPSYDYSLDDHSQHFDFKWILKLDVGLWELACRLVTRCSFRISQILSWKKYHGSGSVQAAVLAIFILIVEPHNAGLSCRYFHFSKSKNWPLNLSIFAGVECPPCKAANHFAT